MRLFLLFVITCCALTGQLRMSVTGKNRPAPPQRQAGDSVELDPSSLDIVEVSNGLTVRLPIENHIQPQLTATVLPSGPLFTYSYVLANGIEAKQAILYFVFECRDPDSVELSAPNDWTARKIPAGVNAFRSLAFVNEVPDSQPARRLWNGREAGPFRMISQLHPGLVRVIVDAAPPETPATELAKGEKLRLLSPWAYQRVLDLDSTDRTKKFLLAIGPGIHPAHDSVSAIRMELAFASAQVEFNGVRLELAKLARDASKETIRSGLAALGGTPFQAQFFQALLWRLAVVKE